MKQKKELKKLLNLNYVDLTNRTYCCGEYDLPYLRCQNIVNPDYLVLYSERNNYLKTDRTFLCFYQFDIKFDTIRGLFEAIYFKDEALLAGFKKRFKGIKYAIAPDYSQLGDINKIENVYRLFKSRVVSLWLWFECNIIVVPNITYASRDYFDVMLDGIQNTETVAFSVKGSMTKSLERKLLLEAIQYTVDNLKYLKKIIVYSVSINDKKVLKLFEYAASRGIEIVIPDNILKNRNVIIKEGRNCG